MTVDTKVAYKCQDCGYVQIVNEHWINDSTCYVGSGAHWCDSCGDGLPVRQPLHERNEAVKLAANDIWENFLMQWTGKKYTTKGE